jgi:hypothetical protein
VRTAPPARPALPVRLARPARTVRLVPPARTARLVRLALLVPTVSFPSRGADETLCFRCDAFTGGACATPNERTRIHPLFALCPPSPAPTTPDRTPSPPNAGPVGPPGPNTLTGQVSFGTVIADMTTGLCDASTQQGTGTTDCLVDTTTDPANPYIIAQFECPVGTTALQNGCIGTGAEAWITAQVQDVNVVQCYYRVPPTTTNFAISVTATCVELEIVNAVSGLALTSSTLLVKDFSRANLNARIRG